MKVLSLKQPYAELVVSGKKTIELRKWKTNFRGEFLIHASKAVDSDGMKKFGFTDLPTGCIVGKAKLVDVKEYSSEEDHVNDRDKHLASSYWGKYGFVLTSAERITPIPVQGKLNFWNFDYNN